MSKYPIPVSKLESLWKTLSSFSFPNKLVWLHRCMTTTNSFLNEIFQIFQMTQFCYYRVQTFHNIIFEQNIICYWKHKHRQIPEGTKHFQQRAQLLLPCLKSVRKIKCSVSKASFLYFLFSVIMCGIFTLDILMQMGSTMVADHILRAILGWTQPENQTFFLLTNFSSS